MNDSTKVVHSILREGTISMNPMNVCFGTHLVHRLDWIYDPCTYLVTSCITLAFKYCFHCTTWISLVARLKNCIFLGLDCI